MSGQKAKDVRNANRGKAHRLKGGFSREKPLQLRNKSKSRPAPTTAK
jgi:hypothetical protein